MIPTLPYIFHKSMILKAVEVVCFDRLLQVLILNGLGNEVDWRELAEWAKRQTEVSLEEGWTSGESQRRLNWPSRVNRQGRKGEKGHASLSWCVANTIEDIIKIY